MPDPRPVGDPAGMLRLAKTLDLASDEARFRTRIAIEQLDPEITAFTGPAGDRTRAEAEDLGVRNQRVVAQLRDLADDLRRRAGTIERRQDAWDRQNRGSGREAPRRRPRERSGFGEEFSP